MRRLDFFCVPNYTSIMLLRIITLFFLIAHMPIAALTIDSRFFSPGMAIRVYHFIITDQTLLGGDFNLEFVHGGTNNIGFKMGAEFGGAVGLDQSNAIDRLFSYTIFVHLSRTTSLLGKHDFYFLLPYLGFQMGGIFISHNGNGQSSFCFNPQFGMEVFYSRPISVCLDAAWMIWAAQPVQYAGLSFKVSLNFGIR